MATLTRPPQEESKGTIMVARPEFDNVPEKQKQQVASFIDSIHSTRFFQPDDKPNKEWRVSYDSTWLDAEHAALKNAVKVMIKGREYELFHGLHIDPINMKKDRAQSRALYLTAKVSFEVQREKAQSIACNAAMFEVDNLLDIIEEKTGPGSTFKVNLNTLRADAALMASILIVSDEFVPRMQLEDVAQPQWNVWQKGYARLCDVAGVQYVFAKTPEVQFNPIMILRDYWCWD